MAKPLISIVIPVYNGSNYLSQAIDSALSQVKNNFEIIVVNDGSSDDKKTDKIARGYGKKIRYFKKKNGGVASALNFGINKMRGDWFAWLSHDDIYLPEKSLVEEKQISKNPNAKILFCNTGLMDAKGKIIRSPNPAYKEKIHGGKWNLYSWIYGCSILIHKSAFKEAGLFNEKNKTTQDQEMIYSLLNTYTFTHIPKLLVYRRNHDESGIVVHADENREESIKMYKKFIKDHGVGYFFPRLKNSKSHKKIASGFTQLATFFLKRGNFRLAKFMAKKSISHHKSIANFSYFILNFPKLLHGTILMYLLPRNIWRGFLQRFKK